MKNEKTQRLTARYDIIQVSYKYAMGIDHRQWDLYETCFTDECEFDFSSFSGKPPTTLTAKQWRTNVESLNGNFDATAHQMTNHVISKLKIRSACGS
jgi:3-phenylpropionate/cinnamic acid dioxygenase small subunit